MADVVILEDEEGLLKAVRPWLRPGAELLVVTPGALKREVDLPGTCRTALLPGECGDAFRHLRADCAVSYGAGPKDSLTLSSRRGDLLWCAIQRELVTVDGLIVDRQEFPMYLPKGMGPLVGLAAAGTLLLLGVEPEKLERILMEEKTPPRLGRGER